VPTFPEFRRLLAAAENKISHFISRAVLAALKEMRVYL
jgi:hypothetical protein